FIIFPPWGDMIDTKMKEQGSLLIRIREEAYEPSNVCKYIEGRIHRARGCVVAACPLAKLLRHHRLRCCGADWIDVRGDHLGHGDSGAKVEWGAGGIRYAKRRAFLH